MAQGDVVFFDQFLVDVQEKIHDLENDTIKVGFTDGTTTPATTTADPRSSFVRRPGRTSAFW